MVAAAPAAAEETATAAPEKEEEPEPAEESDEDMVCITGDPVFPVLIGVAVTGLWLVRLEYVSVPVAGVQYYIFLPGNETLRIV